MLRSMPARTLIEWRALEQLEPFASRKQDWRTASIVWAIINSAPRRRREPWPLKEFLLTFGEPEAPTRRQSAKEQWSMLKRIAMKYAPSKKKGPQK